MLWILRQLRSMRTTMSIGSEWARWDLHVHSPASFMRNQHSSWDEYFDALKNAPDEIKAIAVTDYGTIDGYKKVIQQKENLSNFELILPNIELRIQSPTATETSNLGVDIHLIFNSEEQNHISEIERCMRNLQFRGTRSVYECTRDGFIRLGHELKPDSSDEEALIEGYSNFRPSISDVVDWYTKEKWLVDNCLIVISNSMTSELAGRNGYTQIAAQIRHFSHLIFSSNRSDRDYFIGKKEGHPVDKVIKEIGSLKPCIHGCDKHKASELFLNDQNRFCWIKADRTFEGLKQIIYEPEYRVSIGEHPPRKPLNAINSININFDDDAKMNGETLCYAGVEHALNFSPYFNCLIGGRGSGKSTLLNLLGIYSLNSTSLEGFWKDKVINFEIPSPKNVSLDDDIDKEETSIPVFSFSGTKEFEFLAQTEIEKFAVDQKAFTKSIFERARAQQGSGEFDQYAVQIENEKAILHSIVKTIDHYVSLVIDTNMKRRSKISLEQTTKVLNSAEYQNANLAITQKIKELDNLKASKERGQKMHDNLVRILNEFEVMLELDSTYSNPYDQVFVKSINDLKLIVNQLQKAIENEEASFAAESKKISSEITTLRNSIDKIISGFGYKVENVKQLKSIPEQISRLESEISISESELTRLRESINDSDKNVRSIQALKEKYERNLEKSLTPLIKLLERTANDNAQKNIKTINLEYKFNSEAAWADLARSFWKALDDEDRPSVESYFVKFICDHKKEFDYVSRDDRQKVTQLLEKIESQSLYEAQYIKYMQSIFQQSHNFRKFEILRDIHLNDIDQYMNINVLYDGIDISKVSFGQKCTAVIVIMLLLGNMPLVIDEPEAHLDGSLIANYLVPLLKERKLERQIIFATHNANFVINGDAEKIIILNNETGRTSIVESTIENMSTRDSLLKLEGSAEAFEKRREKLSIHAT